MRLVRRVNGHFERKPAPHVQMRKHTCLPLFVHPFPLQVQNTTFLLERQYHRLDTVGKQVQVDIGPLSDMPGQDTANQPRFERP